MAKKVVAEIKLQIPAGAANPSPPVGPALGQHGVNIMEFCKAFNAQTADQNGRITPVEITVFEDRSFTFITKTPPASVLLARGGTRQGIGACKTSGVGDAPRSRSRATKMPDLTAADVEAAMRGRGTAQPARGGVTHGKARQDIAGSRRHRSDAPLPHGRAVRPCWVLAANPEFDESVGVAVRSESIAPGRPERARHRSAAARDKTVRVLVFEGREGARVGRCHHVGADDVKKIQDEQWLEFDTAIATPDMMGQVGRLGQVLGPRGVMSNPKVGTATFDVAKAVRDVKGGKVEFRVDKAGIVHVAVGKRSFGAEKLLDNVNALLSSLGRAKPAASKGQYVQTIALTTTMGPSVRVDPLAARAGVAA